MLKKNLDHIKQLLQENPKFVFSKEDLSECDMNSYEVTEVTVTGFINQATIPFGFNVKIQDFSEKSAGLWFWEPVYIDKDMNIASIDFSDTTIDNFFLKSDNDTEGSLLCLKGIGNTVLDKI